MESFTLLFFVLMLLVAALIVTLTIRRDLKARERIEVGTRPGPTHAPPARGSARTTLPLPTTPDTQIAAAPPLKTSGR